MALGLAVLIAILVISELLVLRVGERIAADRSQANIGAVARARAVLESEIGASAQLATGLGAYIVATGGKPRDRDLDAMLSVLYRQGRHVRAISLAPGNVVARAVPAGHGQAVGFRYADAPLRWPAVERAIRSRQAVLDGPLALSDGRKGLALRLPVFLDDGRYWGLVSTEIDGDQLREAVQRAVGGGSTGIAVRSAEAGEGPGAAIWGGSGAFERPAAVMEAVVAGGRLQLAIAEESGRRGAGWPDLLRAGGILLAIVLAVAAHQWASTGAVRRRLESALGRSEARFRQVLDGIGEGLWEISLPEGIVRWDERCAQILGYPGGAATMPADLWSVLAYPADRPAAREALQAAAANGGEFQVECRLRTGGDLWQWVELRGKAPAPGGDGMTAIAGILADVSARKGAEFALRESEERSRRLIEALPDFMFVIDTGGRIVECHVPAGTLFCAQSADWTGREYEKVLPPEAAAALTRAITQTMQGAGRASTQVRIESRDRHCDLDVTVTAFGSSPVNPAGFLCLARDLTALRRAEDRARSSETMAGDMVDSLSAHVAVLDHHGVVRSANAAWRQFAAVAGPDLRPQPGQDYLAICRALTSGEGGVEAEAALVGIRAVMTGISGDFHMEYRVATPGGARWFVMHVSPLRAAAGGVVMAHEDVTERKRAENAAREVFVRQHRIAAQLPGVLFQCRQLQDGRLLFPYASDGVRDICGLDPERLRHDGAPLLDLVFPEDRASVLAALNDSGRNRVPWSQQFRLRLADGRCRWMGVDALPEIDEGGIVWNGFMADITGRKAAEDMLWRSEKRYRDLFRMFPLPCLALDDLGRLLEANERWLEMLGWNECGTPSGTCFGDMLVPSDEASFADIRRRATAQGGIRNCVGLRHADGHVIQAVLLGLVELDGLPADDRPYLALVAQALEPAARPAVPHPGGESVPVEVVGPTALSPAASGGDCRPH
ncbi:MAG: PAS domain S-box protein [Rhodocyclaceae bacterium]|nr:PAS domain S-box protein [Rhodocyclaceae bacterium]